MQTRMYMIPALPGQSARWRPVVRTSPAALTAFSASSDPFVSETAALASDLQQERCICKVCMCRLMTHDVIHKKVSGYKQQLAQLLMARILLFTLLLGFVLSLFVLTTKRFPRSDGFLWQIHLGKSRLKTFREKKSQRWLTKLSVHRIEDTSTVAGCYWWAGQHQTQNMKQKLELQTLFPKTFESTIVLCCRSNEVWSRNVCWRRHMTFLHHQTTL